MKKIVLVFGFVLNVACSNAQDEQKITQNKQDSVYCVVMKDGVTILTDGSGRQIQHDVNLADGSRISSTGELTRKDGTRIILKDGDCSNSIRNEAETKDRKKSKSK